MLRAPLIGYPSSGKTTLFHLMTSTREMQRAHGKHDVHIGVAHVPDDRLEGLAALFKPRRRVPAAVEFADLADVEQTRAQTLLDLVPFRNADALLHVLRAFEDERQPHPFGSVNPSRDARTMEDELILADLAVIEKRLERLDRDLKKVKSSELEQERAILVRCREALEQGRLLRELESSDDEEKRLRGFQFLSAKPLLLVVNVGESDLTSGGEAGLEAAVARAGVAHVAGHPATRLVPVCAKVELEIADLDPGDAAAFRADLGLHESGLDRVIRATYDLLGYVTFFTVGDAECHAWPVPHNTPARAAAAAVHTDMARGFIRAEVARYENLVGRGSLAACREHGELRLEGKDYLVQDGDVITFRFAT